MIIGIEGGLVVFLAEFAAGLEIRVAAKGLARVAVHTEEVEVVIALEGAVILTDPVQFLRTKGLMIEAATSGWL